MMGASPRGRWCSDERSLGTLHTLGPQAEYSLKRLSGNSHRKFAPVHDLDAMQLFLRRQVGVQFILQFRWGQLQLARVSQCYGGYRKLRSVRLARSVDARIKYRTVFMNFLLYEETVHGPRSRMNHIHFAVE